MRRILLTIGLLVWGSALSFGQEVIHQDDFESDLSQWVVEQREGGTTRIKEGSTGNQ